MRRFRIWILRQSSGQVLNWFGVYTDRTVPLYTLIPVSPSRTRLCRNSENRTCVILSPSISQDKLREGSAFLPFPCRIGIVFRNQKIKKQILRRSTRQNDIATRSVPAGECHNRGIGA